MLRKYEDLLPGSADRIFLMAEKQSSHRQTLEAKVVASNCSNERLGMMMCFGICVLAICAGVYALSIGKDGYGIAAIVSALAAPAGVFIYGKFRQRKELQARQQGLIEAARQTQRQ